jgi:hypothetical protein
MKIGFGTNGVLFQRGVDGKLVGLAAIVMGVMADTAPHPGTVDVVSSSHVLTQFVPVLEVADEELETPFFVPDAPELADGLQAFLDKCHTAALASGWWTNLKTGVDTRKLDEDGKPGFNVSEKLMLIVSEVSEAMEGHRKNLMDDKIKHRKMIEVELADAIIRIGDLGGAMGLRIGAAAIEKMAYNAVREDHKLANRVKEGGKAF